MERSLEAFFLDAQFSFQHSVRWKLRPNNFLAQVMIFRATWPLTPKIRKMSKRGRKSQNPKNHHRAFFVALVEPDRMSYQAPKSVNPCSKNRFSKFHLPKKSKNMQIFSKSRKFGKSKWWEKYKWGVNRRVSIRQFAPDNFRNFKMRILTPYGRKTSEFGAKKVANLIQKFHRKNMVDSETDSS